MVLPLDIEGIAMKRFDQLLNIICCVFIGIFIASFGYTIFDYIHHPGYYIVQSSPWYTPLIVRGIFTLLIIIVCIGIKIIIKKHHHHTIDQ